MNRKITAAAMAAALVALGGCKRDNSAYDSTAAMATPPAPAPIVDTTTKTIGSTTAVIDSLGRTTSVTVGGTTTTKVTTKTKAKPATKKKSY
jgi:hypothetical protein